MPGPDWRSLPSLTALRTFEAAARLGGFSAAARVLNVTPAAVAQQVRGLEAELGLPLVQREGRGIRLTDHGTRLAEALTEGFGRIADGVTGLRDEEEKRGIRVSCTSGFAQRVLMPRIGEFWGMRPDITVSINSDDRLVDMVREGFDLAIRVGSGNWPGMEAELLAKNPFLLVGAPSLLGEGDPELSRLPWLLMPSSRTDYDWVAAAGYDVSKLRVIPMENGVLAVSAALHGYGLVFTSDALVHEDIEAGRLRVVPFPGLPTAAYYAVTLPGPRRPALQAFVGWLRTLVRK